MVRSLSHGRYGQVSGGHDLAVVRIAARTWRSFEIARRYSATRKLLQSDPFDIEAFYRSAGRTCT